MGETVADTIRELTRRHIAENNGLVLGQCLSAVGWVQNTVPAQEMGIEELPMTTTGKVRRIELREREIARKRDS